MADKKLYFVECSGDIEHDLANAGFRRFRFDISKELLNNPEIESHPNGYHYIFSSDKYAYKCCMLIDDIEKYWRIIHKHCDWINHMIGVNTISDEQSAKIAGDGFCYIAEESDYGELPKEIHMFIRSLLTGMDERFQETLSFGYGFLELPILSLTELPDEEYSKLIEPSEYRREYWTMARGNWRIELYTNYRFSKIPIKEIEKITGKAIDNKIDEFSFYKDGVENYQYRSCHFLVNDKLRYDMMLKYVDKSKITQDFSLNEL